MPSQIPLPTVRELLEAFRGGLEERDETSDARSGSNYNVWAGVGALLFLREATRDRDLFRAIYFDFAEGDVLDDLIDKRFNASRIVLAQGVGKTVLSRLTAAAGQGTILAGTRIAVLPGGAGGVRYYQASTDVPVTSTALGAIVSITSVEFGTGVGFNSIQSPPMLMRIEDPLWDMTWKVASLICADGTNRQDDSDYRAATHKARIDARTGYATAITNACIGAGAAQVALFQSDFLATDPGSPTVEIIGSINVNGYGDVGLNRCFVGDAGFNTSPALITACKLALDSVSMGGTALQVLPMTPTSVTVTVTITLWDDPSKFDTLTLARDVADAIINYFATRKNAFYFRQASMRGAIQRAVRNIQTLVVQTTPAEPVLTSLFNVIPLPRYSVSRGDITVTFLDLLGNLFASYTGP